MEKMKGINKMVRETKAIKIIRKIKCQSIRIPILLTMVAKVRIIRVEHVKFTTSDTYYKGIQSFYLLEKKE